MISRESFIEGMAEYFRSLDKPTASFMGFPVSCPRISKGDVKRFTIPQAFEPGWRIDRPKFDKPPGYDECDARAAIGSPRFVGDDPVRWGESGWWWKLEVKP